MRTHNLESLDLIFINRKALPRKFNSIFNCSSQDSDLFSIPSIRSFTVVTTVSSLRHGTFIVQEALGHMKVHFLSRFTHGLVETSLILWSDASTYVFRICVCKLSRQPVAKANRMFQVCFYL